MGERPSSYLRIKTNRMHNKMTKNIKSLQPHAYRLRLHLIFVSLIIVSLATFLPVYPEALNLEPIKPYIDSLVPTASISAVHCTAVDPKACYAFIGITGLFTPIAALIAFVLSGLMHETYCENKLFYSRRRYPAITYINKEMTKSIIILLIFSIAWYWHFYISELRLIHHGLRDSEDRTTLFYLGVWGFRLTGSFFAILNFVIFLLLWRVGWDSCKIPKNKN